MTTKFVIIGASGGIGSTVARELSQMGAKLLLCGRNADYLEALARELDQDFLQISDASFGSIESCFERAKELPGDLSGVVNCIGSVFLKPAHLTSEEEWNQVLSTNLSSAFATVKYAVQELRAARGSIVLVSTAAASVGLSNHEAIAAAKAGIQGLVLSAAATYAAKGIRVNAVSPGLVETDLTSHITSSESARQFSLKMHPLGRLGKPEDISSAICWLLDPKQSWVSGQTLAVDGGLSTLKTS